MLPVGNITKLNYNDCKLTHNVKVNCKSIQVFLGTVQYTMCISNFQQCDNFQVTVDDGLGSSNGKNVISYISRIYVVKCGWDFDHYVTCKTPLAPNYL